MFPERLNGAELAGPSVRDELVNQKQNSEPPNQLNGHLLLAKGASKETLKKASSDHDGKEGVRHAS